MSEDNSRLEIGHVLFIDIVGYSKLLNEEQKERLNQLTEIVLATTPVREAIDEQLVRLPTGDGMALVFRRSAEEPARCALEIAEALQKHPELPVRMGIHSGPVSDVTDVSGRTNLAGAGINMAQRVMDCGDAGHILLSQHVADDLVHSRQWASRLRDLGECEVKHGIRLHLVNLYAEPLGNAALPQKFQQAAPKPVVEKPAQRSSIGWIAALALLVLLGAVFFLFMRKPTPPVVAAIAHKSVAVLPFENLSSDKENAFFTDGVQDEILTDLSRIADLKVISRTSVMQYKSGAPRNLREIGQQLGVAHVVEGSVQRAANKIRVNAQLIDARTDAHLWAQTYDRDLADVFAIQSEIAKAIADQLQAKLSPREKRDIEQPPTTDIPAFELYSQARDLLTGFAAGSAQNLLGAVDLLNQALARDPSFFAAQCELAFAHDHVYLHGVDHTPARLALAQAALESAFRLRPDAGEAHLARAEHLYAGYLDYDGALAELELARRTLPNNAEIFRSAGAYNRRRGNFEEGLRNFLRAMELDPRNIDTLGQVAICFEILRRYPEAISILDRAVSIRHDDAVIKAGRASTWVDWKADTRPLHQVIDEIRAKQPAEVKEVADVWLLCALAERDAAAAHAALAALGNDLFGDNATNFSVGFGEALLTRMKNGEEKARSAFAAIRPQQEKTVQEQPDYGPAVCVLALIDAGMGRREEALREIQQARELMPVEKDALNGADMIQYSAIVAAWVGEKDLACQQLATAVRLPGFLSYGRLKLLPWWDPLRGDPRFEKIVASLAPKETKQ